MWVIKLRKPGCFNDVIVDTFESKEPALIWCNIFNCDGWWDVTYYVEEVKGESA